MSTLTIILIAFFAVVTQMFVFGSLIFKAIRPDILLITVVFFSLIFTKAESVRAAIICGLIKDMVSASVLGSYTISFVFLAVLLNANKSKFYKEVFFAQFLISAASYIAIEMVVLILTSIASRSPVFAGSFLSLLIKGAICTGFFAPILFLLFSKVLKVRLVEAGRW
ncbi:MAG: rod shape-determining protein MreD [Candidatus Omnitrophota bacterium]